MENDMTEESRPVEVQEIASEPTEDTQTEMQVPEEPVQRLPEDVEESAKEPVEPAQEEDEAVQGQTVPFEEDVAPSAPTDETVEEQGEATESQPVTDDTDVATNPQSAAPTVESVIEAILFATDEPLTDSRIASIVETSAKQVRQSIEDLNAKYEANNNAFRIEQIAGGYQMLTLNLYNPWLKKMLRTRGDNKLSPAALETLAIIAYKQPVIRADIEAVRGVAAGEVIRSLMYKGLVKIVGRAEILGRPMLYGTTKKFLEVFGLNSLKDLPKAEELKNPDRT
jgi:segregation and condensation protein B